MVLSCGRPAAQKKALPITGTFINLPYQDVRNKYTNPAEMDCTDPQMWTVKIAEMKNMGIEYLIFIQKGFPEKSNEGSH